jgi:type II secretory pathway pseudopilin PulG
MVRTNRSQVRRSFTLIELLVVIGIILALVSLSAVAILKTQNYQQRRNTESAVSKLDQGLQRQWKRVIDTAKSETPNAIASTLANGDPRRAQVIHVLMCLKREFPTSFAEAKSPVPGFSPNQTYVRLLSNASAASLARSSEDQASACLYMALKLSRRGGDFDPDTSLSAQEIVDPFNDGIKEINDAWGNPISFMRWPVGITWSTWFTPPIQYGTQQNFSLSNPPDKEDPEGLLNAGWWGQLSAANLALAGNIFSVSPQAYPWALSPPGALYPVSTAANTQYQLTPMIYSKGADGTLWTNDDIYNFLLNP